MCMHCNTRHMPPCAIEIKPTNATQAHSESEVQNEKKKKKKKVKLYVR